MSLDDARRQKSAKAELAKGDRAEGSKDLRSGEAPTATIGHERSGTDHLMEEVIEASNAKKALKREPLAKSRKDSWEGIMDRQGKGN